MLVVNGKAPAFEVAFIDVNRTTGNKNLFSQPYNFINFS